MEGGRKAYEHEIIFRKHKTFNPNEIHIKIEIELLRGGLR
jgi:hypothetical protein